MDDKGSAKQMNVSELADYLSVHPSTIYRLLRRNQIPGFRVGTCWRFNIETIDHWRLRDERLGD
jgi:excisionase family DNA binding protein